MKSTETQLVGTAHPTFSFAYLPDSQLLRAGAVNCQLSTVNCHMIEPEVTICPGYLSPIAATKLYTQLRDRIEWDLRISARKTACFGLPYNYSGLTYELQPMHPLLQPVAKQLAATLGFEPNSCLVNYYQDGRDKMGFHSDEIDNLEAGTQIIIISLGTERKLSFRSKADYEQRLNYLLPHGSLLYMSQKTQEFWSHAIKRANVIEGRISLTFRRIDPLYRAANPNA